MEEAEAYARGYRGEPIDIHQALEDAKRLTEQAGWRRDTLPLFSEDKSRHAELLAYHRVSHPSRHRLYLSTGIHGDEPAGPQAVVQLLRENIWPKGVDIWLCPCLNLTGFPLNRRENIDGIDLNRDYRHLQSAEVRAHVDWLKRKPNFDVTLCLHEDWEAKGFYLYELNPDNQPSLANILVSRVAEVCPIDGSETIDGWAADQGIIRPERDPSDRPQWPEAVFLIANKTRLSYTLETPSSFPLQTRVAAHVQGVRAVLEALSKSQ